MTHKEWLEKMCQYEIRISLINEPIDFTVDEPVKPMSALERAHRIWGMSDEESEGTRDR
jgi:hypothetical protein